MSFHTAFAKSWLSSNPRFEERRRRTAPVPSFPLHFRNSSLGAHCQEDRARQFPLFSSRHKRFSFGLFPPLIESTTVAFFRTFSSKLEVLPDSDLPRARICRHIFFVLRISFPTRVATPRFPCLSMTFDFSPFNRTMPRFFCSNLRSPQFPPQRFGDETPRRSIRSNLIQRV